MTKLGMRRTIPSIPLKRKAPLKRSKDLNKMSERAKKELTVWMVVKHDRMMALLKKFFFIPCEYCKKPIIEGSELWCAEGHHNNHNRRDNRFENCRILHRVCNQQIENWNTKDVPSLL